MGISRGSEPQSNRQGRLMPWNEILDAASDALITARCRNAYAHELRGSLHPISLAMELLLRASSSAAKKPDLLEQATALAKRAMGVLEQSSVDLLKQITLADDVAGTVNLGELLDGVLRLLRTDLDQKAIAFTSSIQRDVAVHAETFKLRKTLLGLVSLSIDELQRGADMSIVLSRAGGDARIEIIADIDFPHIEFSETLFTRGDALTPYAVILSASRQWFAGRGGNLEVKRMPPCAIDLHYPLTVTAVAPQFGEIPRADG